MIKQRTLKQSFSLEGKGLHSGIESRITFNPAPANFGYKIRRTDIPGEPVIDAVAENVVNTGRSTVLAVNGIKVATVEHALAALYGCEIDNCLIDINGSEFPILDGSAILFVKKIKEVGVQIQDVERKYITLKNKRVRVTDKDTGASMTLFPDDSFAIQTTISFDSIFLKHQYACLNSLSDFVKEFASARTFVFVKEIIPLLENNLIKGGDLDNAIVIYDELIEQNDFNYMADLIGVKRKDSKQLGYIMNKSLLYVNEPARHKTLDILGDLALVGYFINGRIIANRPGHKINNQFARAIRQTIDIDKMIQPGLDNLANKIRKNKSNRVQDSIKEKFEQEYIL